LVGALESLFNNSTNGGNVGGVHLLGHSLGAGIVADATDTLLRKPNIPFTIEKLTLFDGPEDFTAQGVRGKVTLAPKIASILGRSQGSELIVENYVAGNILTGFGSSYKDISNTYLFGYNHFGDATPMGWYTETIGAKSGFKGQWGINEVNPSSRNDQVWANKFPLAGNDPHDLHPLLNDVNFITPVSLFEYKTFMTASENQKSNIDSLKDSAKSVARDLLLGGISLAADFLVFNIPTTSYGAIGKAELVNDVGLVLTTNSPSYAFTTIDVPFDASFAVFEFMPEIWGDEDIFLIAFDDIILYSLKSEFFTNELLNTGYLDVSRWAGQQVLLTFGLLSNEAGHKVAVTGYGFARYESADTASVPNPSPMLLLLAGLIAFGFNKRQKTLH
jgi:hypothetical protein